MGKRLIAMAAIAAVLATGCSSGGSNAKAANTDAAAGKSGGSGDGGGKQSATSAAKSASGLPIWDENRKMNDITGYSSPIASALGYDAANNDPSRAQAQLREQLRKQEEVIAACMKQQGWEYTPRENQIGDSFQPPGYDLTRKEYVEKYGFGISTSMEEAQTAPQPANVPEDPNDKYMQSLSQSEREAYQKALYGKEFLAGLPTADQTGDAGGGSDGGSDSGSGGAATTAAASSNGGPQIGGCQGEGEKAMRGDANQSAEDTAFTEEMQKRLTTLYEKAQADPRVVAATRAYASCMADKGYPEIDKQQTAYEKVNEKMQAVFGGGAFPAGGSGVAATIAVAAPASTASGDDSGGPQGPDPAKLAEVKTYELGVAKADLACGKDVMKTSYEVQQELEKTFVEQNQADLARYKTLTQGRIGGSGG